jgi:hypothetical protein
MPAPDTNTTAPRTLGFLGQPRQVLLILLGMLLFSSAAVVIIRFYNKPALSAEKVVQQRLERLANKREAETSQLCAYAWVDKAAGKVQLPVARAVELTIAELQAKPVKGTSVAPTPAAPAPAAAP